MDSSATVRFGTIIRLAAALRENPLRHRESRY